MRLSGYRPAANAQLTCLGFALRSFVPDHEPSIPIMAQETSDSLRPRFWIVVVGVIILLIFLYFYKPFESYVVAHIPSIHFHNVVF